MSNQYRPIDSIRGIFALMIVWHHLCPAFGISYHFDFGNTIVLFFFVLSGYANSLSWKNKIKGSEKAFIIKRCIKIFPIQWLTVILFTLFKVNVATYWAIPFHLTLTQSMVPLWQINFSLNSPSWFLSSLFFCYLCTPIILKYAITNKNKFVLFYIIATASFSLIIFLLSKYIGLRWLVYINPAARLLDYGLGIILGIYWDEISCLIGRRESHKWLYTIAEITLIIILFIFMFYKPLIALNDFNVIRYPVIAGVIILFSISKGFTSSLLKNDILQWLGSIAMSIYMIHEFILHFFMSLNNYIPNTIIILLTYATIIIVAYVTEKALYQYSNHIMKYATIIFKLN